MSLTLTQAQTALDAWIVADLADAKLLNMMSQGDFVAHMFPDLYEALRQDLKGRLVRILIFSIALLNQRFNLFNLFIITCC